jgi:uncharacterized protein (DUF1778 family)
MVTKPKKLREERITIRLAPSEARAMERAARAMGISVSTWIRVQALAALRESP